MARTVPAYMIVYPILVSWLGCVPAAPGSPRHPGLIVATFVTAAGLRTLWLLRRHRLTSAMVA